MQSANDFIVYFTIIGKRLWVTILLLIVTLGVILSVSMTAEPIYRATVRLQVLATDRTDVSLFGEYRAISTVNEIQQAQNDFVRALKSGFVAWKTIAELNLEVGAVDLLDGLSTSLEGDFIVVTVESDDPGRAEDIANTQVANALEYYRNVRATPSRVLGVFVTEQLTSQRAEMLVAQRALLQFKQEHAIDSLQQETRAIQDMIRVLKLELDRAIIEQDRSGIFAKTYRAQQAKAEAKVNEIEQVERAMAARF